MAVDIHESDLRYYYSDRYRNDPNGIGGVKNAALDRSRRGIAVLVGEPSARPFLVGNSLGIVDVYLFMLAARYPDPVVPARIARLEAGLRAHPITGTIWARHFSGNFKASN